MDKICLICKQFKTFINVEQNVEDYSRSVQFVDWYSFLNKEIPDNIFHFQRRQLDYQNHL